MNQATNDYILSSEVEAERLDVQAQVWQHDVEALLNEIGVGPGWRCLDLGCGAVGILEPLSRRVGAEGQVVGVDRDPALLDAARAFARARGLSNVEILERDAFHTGLPAASFDLVHVRFVMAFGRGEALVQEMVRLARPGGIVVVQETDQSSWNYFDRNGAIYPVWQRLRPVLEAAFERFGGDTYVGQKTPVMLRRAGLEEVQVRATVKAMQGSHPYMRMPIIGAQGLRPVILSGGLMSEGELDDTLAEMERIIGDPETYETTFTVTQVWGRKPAPP